MMRNDKTGRRAGIGAACAMAALAGALCLGGCGGHSAGTADSYSTGASGGYARQIEEGAWAADDYDAEEPSMMAGASGAGAWAANDAASSDREAKAASPDDAPIDESVEAADSTQKLVRTADISIEATSYDDVMSKIREEMSKGGAFAESQDEQVRSNGTRYASITIRVPADRYQAVMDGLAGAGGKVVSKSEHVENITRVYADNEAVIKGLEIQEGRLLEMMGKAETVEDMLSIESRLSDVQIELNRVRSSREAMDSQVSLSTISVFVSEVERESVNEKESYGSRARHAFDEMCDDFVDTVQDLGIDLIYAIPGIVLLAVLALILRALVRKAYRTGKKRREEAAERQAAQVAHAQAGQAPQAAPLQAARMRTDSIPMPPATKAPVDGDGFEDIADDEPAPGAALEGADAEAEAEG